VLVLDIEGTYNLRNVSNSFHKKQSLMMEAEVVSETLGTHSILTRLIVQEYVVEFSRHESIKLCTPAFPKVEAPRGT
jgi:hypothetical protein